MLSTFTVSSTAKYKYYNRNPDRVHLKDCVCRAISTATGLQYTAIEKLLELSATACKCEPLNVDCYKNLLEGVFNLPRFDCGFTKTVKDVAEEHPLDKVIIRVDQHLTSALYGVVLDIWDCSDELVDCFWIVS